MNKINRTILARLALGAVAFLNISQVQADSQGSNPDLATLQAKVNEYVSTSMMNELNSLSASYDAMHIGQTYTMDSGKLGPESDGNADSIFTQMTYTGKTASQLIGYADDQCAAHTTYDALVAKGIVVDKVKFDSVRNQFCKLVNGAAELKHRYDKYQSIKANGIVLAKRAKSDKHDFKGYTRTFGVGMSLVYKPDIANTLENGVHPDETLIYNSWIKWSDDNPTPLNIIKKIREMRNDSASNCDGISFHVIDGKEVDGWLYLNVVNVSSSKITIQNCAKVDYHGTHKTHGFPAFTLDAPFGYLYELEQMKDSGKAKLKDTIKTKVVSMVGANKEMITLMQKLLGNKVYSIQK